MRLKDTFKTFAYQLLVLVFIFTVCEIGSFIFLVFKIGLKRTIYIHPLVEMLSTKKHNKEVPLLGGFSPLSQDRYRPNSKYRGLDINKCGYIVNSLDSLSIDCVKSLRSNKGIKIFLLGGSSTAGTGVKNNSETISAFLEKDLNNRFKNKNIKVYNFGAGASYTFRQSQLINSEINYYYPDIVISFDGFNDAFYWALEPLRFEKNLKIKPAIPNWAKYSYKNYLHGLGLNANSLYGLKDSITGNTRGWLFPYITELASMYSNQLQPMNPWKFSPEYIISRERLDIESRSASEYFYNNIATSAGSLLLNNKNSCYIQIIQGDSHHKSKSSEGDIKARKKWHSKFERKWGVELNEKSYWELLEPIYSSYVQVLKEDKSRLKDIFKQRYTWEDFTELMNIKAPYITTYKDNIHTTKHGNKIIANEMRIAISKTACYKKFIE